MCKASLPMYLEAHANVVDSWTQNIAVSPHLFHITLGTMCILFTIIGQTRHTLLEYLYDKLLVDDVLDFTKKQTYKL